MPRRTTAQTRDMCSDRDFDVLLIRTEHRPGTHRGVSTEYKHSGGHGFDIITFPLSVLVCDYHVINYFICLVDYHVAKLEMFQSNELETPQKQKLK